MRAPPGLKVRCPQCDKLVPLEVPVVPKAGRALRVVVECTCGARIGITLTGDRVGPAAGPTPDPPAAGDRGRASVGR